jgi:hypothetical protein
VLGIGVPDPLQDEPMLLNRELFARDPLSVTLPNNGVAKVAEPQSPQEWEVLRHELHTFVCEGEYQRGLDRILSSYLRNLGQPEQPAVWVSGFYGSGKSHLVRVLEFLWRDLTFPDGATARGLVSLPPDITAHLRELTTVGRRDGGLWSAAGTLSAGDGDSVRLALLGILLRSAGLPEQHPTARFVLWLMAEGFYETVRAAVEQTGKSWVSELRQLYVSPVLACSLIQAYPGFAATESAARALLREQFPRKDEITDDEFVACMADVLALRASSPGRFPCTLIVLDELQQYIGSSPERSFRVQELVQICVARFQSRLLFVATGQSALQETPQLQRIQGRFTVPVQLSDTDVEKVIRQVILRKAPDKTSAIAAMMAQCSGEIDRHLLGSKIAPSVADREAVVPDYPLLPVRRRFWDRVLRALDRSGAAGQLRNQLRIVHEGSQKVAEKPLGSVIPGDLIYDQLSPSLLQTGALLREVDETIKGQRDGSPDGELRSRLCALSFLIGRLDDDVGVRATAETFADLIVEYLPDGSAALRQRIPVLLSALVENGNLLQVSDEYRLQTREGQEWERAYRGRYAQILDDDGRIASERIDRLKKAFEEAVRGLVLTQGSSKAPRRLDLHFGAEAPRKDTGLIPVWIRDEWSAPERAVREDAQAEGPESPVMFVFIPSRNVDALKAALAGQAAAKETLDVRGGAVTTPDGEEAKAGMVTRLGRQGEEVDRLISQLLGEVTVLLGGGTPVSGDTLREAIRAGTDAAMVRLFGQFSPGDHAQWNKVADRARQGSGDALAAVAYTGEADKHPACQLMLAAAGVSGKKGSELRGQFQAPPFGWTQDAVDGALLALVAGGYLRASLNAQPATVKQLDRPNLGKAEFRREGAVITAVHRIQVRKLLSDAGIAPANGDEAAILPQYVMKLLDLAQAAGGDPPQPAPPVTAHLAALRLQSGNELVLAAFEQREALERERQEWTATKAAIESRLPRWRALERLLAHVRSLSIEQEVSAQADAIRQTRALLADPDPVPPLCGQLTNALRSALQDVHGRYTALHAARLRDLEESDAWQSLDEEQRRRIFVAQALDAVPPIRVGTEAEVSQSLDAMPLSDWEHRIAGLPERFSQALLAASRLLEPEAVRVALPGATLKTEQEVEDYLGRVRALLLQQIRAGHPVVL